MKINFEVVEFAISLEEFQVQEQVVNRLYARLPRGVIRKIPYQRRRKASFHLHFKSEIYMQKLFQLEAENFHHDFCLVSLSFSLVMNTLGILYCNAQHQEGRREEKHEATRQEANASKRKLYTNLPLRIFSIKFFSFSFLLFRLAAFETLKQMSRDAVLVQMKTIKQPRSGFI